MHFQVLTAICLNQVLEKEGLDPEQLAKKEKVDFDSMSKSSELKAWRDIWSAGHGVGAIKQIDTTAGIIKQLENEYRDSLGRLTEQAGKIKGIISR